PLPVAEMPKWNKEVHKALLGIKDILEKHYRDVQDIEFTIERGTLWMLQTRVGKRTAAAAFRIATQLVDEGLIDADEAVRRVSGAQLVQLMFPRFDTSGKLTKLGQGMSASPGAAVGKAVFDSYTAVKWQRSGEKVILVRRETNPDDLNGMIAAEGILTSRGGKTSHAAVVARGMGKTCVCGAEELNVDTKRRRLTAPGGVVVEEGDVISVDGSSGLVYAGEVPVVAPPVVEYFEGTLDPDGDQADDLVRAVHRVMTRADEVRRLRVRANADTVEDAERARRFGGEGIGLCRTEHMFLGERRQHVERLILAEDDKARDQALEALLPLQRWDFLQILTAMDGLPTTVRLLDPPLHEFLPDLPDLAAQVERARIECTDDLKELEKLLEITERISEENPMLGTRGCRLGILYPEIYEMQVHAILRAAKAMDDALEALLPAQRADFIGILEAMDGLPVTIRLLDPPLHEFLPNITELSVRVAVAESRGEAREGDLRMLQAVHRLHEQNPMLGLRGVRLGVVIPGLFAMQARAILEAAAV
ncbi:MAG TPA: putative PEP-binding protein, partial [Streptomyces sp.]|nr:putative PEP-binding protein [Streptomyces sp.]